MKCKFLKVAFVVTIAMVGGINVFNAQNSEALSDVVLANVEALANNEFEVPNCSNPNGYKIWYTEKDETLPNGAIRNQKRGFYDCCYVKEEGYLPSGSCV